MIISKKVKDCSIILNRKHITMGSSQSKKDKKKNKKQGKKDEVVEEEVVYNNAAVANKNNNDDSEVEFEDDSGRGYAPHSADGLSTNFIGISIGMGDKKEEEGKSAEEKKAEKEKKKQEKKDIEMEMNTKQMETKDFDNTTNFLGIPIGVKSGNSDAAPVHGSG